MSYCEQADILTLPLLCVWIILASKYILDKTNIFQRQIALLSFKLGGTMKDKHVENWLTSSKCFCLSLITLQNGSLTSLSHLTKNQIGKTRHRLIILVEKINAEFYLVHSKYHFWMFLWSLYINYYCQNCDCYNWISIMLSPHVNSSVCPEQFK